MKYKMKVYLNLGLLTLEECLILQQYIPEVVFTQRKSYDEYFVDQHGLFNEIPLSLPDLVELGKVFDITIGGEYSVVIESY